MLCPLLILYFHKLLRKCGAENDIWFYWSCKEISTTGVVFYTFYYYQKIATWCEDQQYNFASSAKQVAVVDVLLRCSHIFCPFLFGSNRELPPHRHSINPHFMYCYNSLIF